jgi:peptidoglycan biosynthesis protein MviN/MurJ (putative lipid II flippase)
MIFVKEIFSSHIGGTLKRHFASIAFLQAFIPILAFLDSAVAAECIL